MVVQLKDVSLCAIVRDEMINPAGGIVEFLDSTLPYVAEGVVVDTGSIDGTREVLEEMQAKYSHLKVVDHKFDGYGPSRNVSLDHVKTEYALILDADERLTEEDFEKVEKEIERRPNVGIFYFGFMNICPPNIVIPQGGILTRLLKPSIGDKRVTFYANVWESLSTMPGKSGTIGVDIKHFLANPHAMGKKMKDWYSLLSDPSDPSVALSDIPDTSPSKISSFKEWKRPNESRHDILSGRLELRSLRQMLN